MDSMSFSIKLDSLSRAYYAGQYITGKIILNNEEEVPTRGIAVRFCGTATLTWTESVKEESGDSLQNVIKRHANKETYMDEELYAFGRAGAPKDSIIQPGSHEFPFTYQLPPNVPSTFHFDNGQVIADVVYRVEAKIKRSAWKSDHKTDLEFIVKAVMNVKRFSQSTQPVVVFKEKHLCCFCCKDGPITMNVKMSKTGYMPGDPINFTVDITNFSSKRVSSIEAHIEQETRFLSSANSDKHESVKSFQEIILKAQPGPSIESNQTGIWNGEIITPEVLPTNLGGCHIILRSYTLKINANLIMSLRGIKAGIPLTIGSAAKNRDNLESEGTSEENIKNSPSTPNFNGTYLPPDYKDVVKDDVLVLDGMDESNIRI